MLWHSTVTRKKQIWRISAEVAGQAIEPVAQSTPSSGPVQSSGSVEKEKVEKEKAAPDSSRYSVAVQPHFDVVRIAPDGAAVLAGRAPPGTHVHIHNESGVNRYYRSRHTG